MTEMERSLVVLCRNLKECADESTKEMDWPNSERWQGYKQGEGNAFGLGAKWLREILERGGLDVEKEEEVDG